MLDTLPFRWYCKMGCSAFRYWCPFALAFASLNRARPTTAKRPAAPVPKANRVAVQRTHGSDWRTIDLQGRAKKGCLGMFTGHACATI